MRNFFKIVKMKSIIISMCLFMAIGCYAAQNTGEGVFRIKPKQIEYLTTTPAKGYIRMVINDVYYSFQVTGNNSSELIEGTVALRREIQEADTLQISYSKDKDWKWKITDLTTYYGDYKIPRLNKIPGRHP